ncbi:hypothetical protein L2E82_46879 [Cichorium intybus]|uniref:Uncharacterized protein n=1 Tax=Cichorium intybus TaxID=13427 RepID=A0ACB8YU60_CICIN|nr:hypothetical protein L2E82_46879 [Cichorium intybus]
MAVASASVMGILPIIALQANPIRRYHPPNPSRYIGFGAYAFQQSPETKGQDRSTSSIQIRSLAPLSPLTGKQEIHPIPNQKSISIIVIVIVISF